MLDVVGKGGGAPLPADVRGQMEAGLGADFGDVRVHDTGEAAAQIASLPQDAKAAKPPSGRPTETDAADTPAEHEVADDLRLGRGESGRAAVGLRAGAAAGTAA